MAESHGSIKRKQQFPEEEQDQKTTCYITMETTRFQHQVLFSKDLLSNIFRIGFSSFPYEWYPLFLVCKLWKEIAYKALDPSVNHSITLAIACEGGFVESVKRLLRDDRIDPTNGKRYNGLTWAYYYSHSNVVSLLLQDPRMSRCMPSKCVAFHGISNMTIKRKKKLGLYRKRYNLLGIDVSLFWKNDFQSVENFESMLPSYYDFYYRLKYIDENLYGFNGGGLEQIGSCYIPFSGLSSLGTRLTINILNYVPELQVFMQKPLQPCGEWSEVGRAYTFKTNLDRQKVKELIPKGPIKSVKIGTLSGYDSTVKLLLVQDERVDLLSNNSSDSPIYYYALVLQSKA